MAIWILSVGFVLQAAFICWLLHERNAAEEAYSDYRAALIERDKQIAAQVAKIALRENEIKRQAETMAMLREQASVAAETLNRARAYITEATNDITP